MYLSVWHLIEPSGPASLGGWLSLVGQLLWLVTYLLIIRIGFKDRSYGIPLLAICLNITWEVYLSFICPGSSIVCPKLAACCVAGQEVPICPAAQGLSLWIARVWFLLDCVIFCQLLVYGKAQQVIPEIKRHFYVVVALAVVLSAAGQFSFIRFFLDENGTIDAWMILVLMNVLFSFMLFVRPGQQGMSYAAAWTKLLGDLLIAVGLILADAVPAPNGSAGFMFFLMGSAVLFDVLYLLAFTVRRRAQLEA